MYLLEPGRLLPRVEITSIDSGPVDDRRCWIVDTVVTSLPGPLRSQPPMWANEGDRHVLHIDQVYGVALRMEAHWRNQPSSIRQATSTVFDVPLDQALFEF